ncbi:MAG: hypothetical protein WCP58_12510, partial [bacterium]
MREYTLPQLNSPQQGVLWQATQGGGMMFNRNAFDNSRPDGMPVLEVYEKDEKETRPRRFVPLVRSDLSGEVLGSLASLKLVQVFRYSREQMGTDLNLSPFEAAYRF